MTNPGRTDGGAERLRVDLGERAYDIVVGDDLIGALGDLVRPVVRQPRVAVVTDTTVAALYLEPAVAALESAGVAAMPVVLPAGEATKDFDHLNNLAERLLEARIERQTTVIALGGGVVGDIAGFAAGILLRGLDYIQVPTTLLAQVDSAVGGKTGINTRQGKNLVGLFHQPRLVVADVGVLDTLDPRQVRAGYAEVAKYGLIADESFFAWLEDNGRAVIDGHRAARRRAVITSCAAKAAIVGRDERERGDRALLNLGHTFGHALEAETGFSDTLLHGEAVAIGMVMAFAFSASQGLCPPADAERVRRHLTAVGLPTDVSDVGGRPWSAAALADHMSRDKKVRDGGLTFILARGIGRAFVSHGVPTADVAAFLDKVVEGLKTPQRQSSA